MSSRQLCKKLIRELAIHHLDLSIPHWNQPQDKLDFFKREVVNLFYGAECPRLNVIFRFYLIQIARISGVMKMVGQLIS